MQGGLPTFIDVGSSFSAAAVTEDNLIDQLRHHDKQLVTPCSVVQIKLHNDLNKVAATCHEHNELSMCLLVCPDGDALLQAFYGDDTWMQLFPTQFQHAIPFSSFNVMDLHTVDDGVWQVSTVAYSEFATDVSCALNKHSMQQAVPRADIHTSFVPSCTCSTRTCAPLSPAAYASHYTAGGPCLKCTTSSTDPEAVRGFAVQCCRT